MAAAATTATLGLGALLGAVAAAPSPAHAQSPARAAPAPQVERALIAEMNRVRAAAGRAALRPIATLTRPARAHSRYLLASGTLSHEGRGGAPFWARLVAAGFPRNRAMGENLAQTPGCDAASARQAVRLWMASRGHRVNLMNPRFRWVGAGVAIAADCSSAVLTADYGS